MNEKSFKDLEDAFKTMQYAMETAGLAIHEIGQTVNGLEAKLKYLEYEEDRTKIALRRIKNAFEGMDI